MPHFAGFDIFSFGFPKFDDLMKSLIAHYPIKWVGFYFERTGMGFTKDNYNKLVSWGYGIAPVFFGKQLGQVPAKGDPFEFGRTQGGNAVRSALAAGIKTGSYLYFDVEPGMPDAAWLLHYAGWCDAVLRGQYRNGAYIRWEIVNWLYAELAKVQKAKGLRDAVSAPRIWAVNYKQMDPARPPNASTPPVKLRGQPPTTPTSPIGPEPSAAHPFADMYQWNPGQFFQWTDSKTGEKFELFPVDLDTSTDQDPGFPDAESL
jgi:hypothetical protein